eukprot:2859905-Pyramimonas_sp.AAC.1
MVLLSRLSDVLGVMVLPVPVALARLAVLFTVVLLAVVLGVMVPLVSVVFVMLMGCPRSYYSPLCWA